MKLPEKCEQRASALVGNDVPNVRKPNAATILLRNRKSKSVCVIPINLLNFRKFKLFLAPYESPFNFILSDTEYMSESASCRHPASTDKNYEQACPCNAKDHAESIETRFTFNVDKANEHKHDRHNECESKSHETKDSRIASCPVERVHCLTESIGIYLAARSQIDFALK